MNRWILIGGLIAATMACSCEQQPADSEKSAEPETLNTSYDAKLAEKLGADDYGMKRYVMAFLKKGPNRDQDSLEGIRLQRAHLDNIKRLAAAHKLIVAGPFMDDSEVRGIYIFNVETIEEAEALTQTDPAIQAGRLVMELHEWYGSAALMECAGIHKKIAKSEI